MSHNINYVKSKMRNYPQTKNTTKGERKIMKKDNLKQHNIIDIMRSYDFIALRKTTCPFCKFKKFFEKNA